MKLNIRRLKEEDFDVLTSWWKEWPEWEVMPRSYYPDNGKGGCLVEKDNKPIVAGFIYLTNSKGALLEWIVSDPNYRDDDRQEAIELLISGCENVCKSLGYEYVFSIGRTKKLIDTHKKMGWHVDDNPSSEMIKTLNN